MDTLVAQIARGWTSVTVLGIPRRASVWTGPKSGMRVAGASVLPFAASGRAGRPRRPGRRSRHARPSDRVQRTGRVARRWGTSDFGWSSAAPRCRGRGRHVLGCRRGSSSRSRTRSRRGRSRCCRCRRGPATLASGATANLRRRAERAPDLVLGSRAHAGASGESALSVNVRRDAHHRGINDLEGENGDCRTCWRRARMVPAAIRASKAVTAPTIEATPAWARRSYCCRRE